MMTHANDTQPTTKCKLYFCAGEGFAGDLSGFEALGVEIIRKPDIEMLKSPVYGSEEFLMGFCHDKLVEIDDVFEEIMDLPSKHSIYLGTVRPFARSFIWLGPHPLSMLRR